VSGMVTLRPPTLAECQLVREWRNDPAVLPMLRTGYKTEAEQGAFYRRHVAPSWLWRVVDAILGGQKHRYFALLHDGALIGMGGLTHLRRRRGEGEISLILSPAHRGRGHGRQCVRALLDEAWRSGLRAVDGECYVGGATEFWRRMRNEIYCGWTLGNTWPGRERGSTRWRWERTA
jgi:RimJ/RimL family protein N-acetyltransferase